MKRNRMRRATLAMLAAVLGLAGICQGETSFVNLSVTATSQTTYFSAPRASIMLCNYGTNNAYYRLFDENDVNTGTPGAATTASTLLVAGSSTAPICVSWSKAPTQGAYFKAISIVCDTAQTATVHVLSE